jgi:hypothetical protein
VTESQARGVDALCKSVATIGLIVGGSWTLYTYFNARAAEARTAAIEAKKPFLAKRLELYAESVDLASRLAMGYGEVNEPHGTQAEKEKFRKDMEGYERRFSELDLGMMRLVEDKEVAEKMEKFRGCIARPGSCTAMYGPAKQLADKCKNSIRQEWEVSISESDTSEEDDKKQ